MTKPRLCQPLLAATLVLATALPSIASSNICDFRAYSDDSDPAGTNVRGGPGTANPVIGVLKAETDAEGYVFSPQFAVAKFDNGWFEIGDASTGQYGDGPVQTVFKGPGWVSAKLVGFDIEDPNMREAPSLDAAVTVELAPETAWALDAVSLTTIHGCDGGFLDVTLTNASGEARRGWVTHLCGNQATTCP